MNTLYPYISCWEHSIPLYLLSFPTPPPERHTCSIDSETVGCIRKKNGGDKAVNDENADVSPKCFLYRQHSFFSFHSSLSL